MSFMVLVIHFSFFLQQGGLPSSIKDLPLFTEISTFQVIRQRVFLCGDKYFFKLSKSKILVNKEKLMGLT